MCFTIRENFPKRKIATEALTCYKRLEYASYDLDPQTRKEKGLRVNSLVSIFQYMQYKVRTTYTSKLLVSRKESYGEPCINVGLHSYTTLKTAKSCKRHNEVLIECVIPKGAKYYKDHVKDEYVSDTLKTIRLIK